jgi:hypothetical protein
MYSRPSKGIQAETNCSIQISSFDLGRQVSRQPLSDLLRGAPEALEANNSSA